MTKYDVPVYDVPENDIKPSSLTIRHMWQVAIKRGGWLSSKNIKIRILLTKYTFEISITSNLEL